MIMDEWIGLLACGGHLVLAMSSYLFGKGSPLRLPLVLLCINLFCWNFADWADHVTHLELWDWLDASASPMAIPLVLHVVLAFVGKLRARRSWLLLTYGLGGVLSIVGLFGTLVPDFRLGFRWKDWARIMIGMVVPVVLSSLFILIRHFRIHRDREERKRTILVVTALAVGGGLGLTDVADELTPAIPNLTAPATLCAVLILFLVLLRYRLFGSSPTAPAVGYLVVLAATAVSLNVMAVVALSTQVATLVFALTTIGVAAAVLLRELVTLLLGRENRLRELALLGRMSAQMAHDVKNPLAALKGAVQCLQAELASTTPSARTERMLRLAVEQVDRVAKTVERYGRMSRVEPALGPTALGDVVTRTVGAFAGREGFPRVVATIASPLPVAQADGELVALAVQNLVANSVEAMTESAEGCVTVGVQSMPGGGSRTEPGVSISVSDNGPGMEARVLEQAWDEFFTTKAQGSGLGLAFVRRVAEAHRGTAHFDSLLGCGSTVRLWFPLHALNEQIVRKRSGG